MPKNSHTAQKNCSEPSDNMRVEVFDNFESLQHLRQQWDEFVESVEGDIYLSYDWCRVWWRHYGTNRNLRIMLFKKKDVLVGIIPFFIEHFRLFPFHIKIAKIVGADFTLKVINPTFCKGYGESIIRQAHSCLFGKDGCDAVFWGPMSENQQSSREIADCLNNNPSSYVKKIESGQFTLFHLPDDHESYLSSLPKSIRQNFRRRVNKIQQNRSLNLMCFGEPDPFFDFIEMHEEQWKSVHKLGHFKDWPGAKDFHADLVKAHAPLDRVRLYGLFADNVPVAYRYGYRFGKRYHSLLPARKCTPEWHGLGLGQLTHMMTVEAAIKEGINEIDAGRGYYEHKLKLGGKEYPVFSYLISNSNAISLIRMYIFMFISFLFHLFYYRLWFNKLAPKLPFKRKPLWKLWIRTRL